MWSTADDNVKNLAWANGQSGRCLPYCRLRMRPLQVHLYTWFHYKANHLDLNLILRCGESRSYFKVDITGSTVGLHNHQTAVAVQPPVREKNSGGSTVGVGTVLEYLIWF